ncbi:MAG: tRNA (adenosine(37)-N6)-threonylcarbamoyltransferase complex transferase subunit TsaD, partial [Actinomycetota bacterium]
EEDAVDTLVIGGGFSANSQLRELAAARGEAAGIDVRIPPIRFCTDNGAMIAALGSALVRNGAQPSSLGIGVDSSMPLSTVFV